MSTIDKAAQLRIDAQEASRRIGNDSSLSSIGKRNALAELAQETNAKLASMKSEYLSAQEKETREAIDRARRIVLAHPVSVDEMSKRDAMSRAAQLTSEEEGLALLASATRIGDAVLVREVVAVSLHNGWLNLINTYEEANPHLTEELTLLWHERHRSPMEDAVAALKWEAREGSAFAPVFF